MKTYIKMTSRSGPLSDEYILAHCQRYRPIPLGAAQYILMKDLKPQHEHAFGNKPLKYHTQIARAQRTLTRSPRQSLRCPAIPWFVTSSTLRTPRTYRVFRVSQAFQILTQPKVSLLLTSRRVSYKDTFELFELDTICRTYFKGV